MGFHCSFAAAAANRRLSELAVAGNQVPVWGSSSYVRSIKTRLGASANVYRLEEAVDPGALSQEKIVENLSPEEAKRLSKVRNIGIAVCVSATQFEID